MAFNLRLHFRYKNSYRTKPLLQLSRTVKIHLWFVKIERLLQCMILQIKDNAIINWIVFTQTLHGQRFHVLLTWHTRLEYLEQDVSELEFLFVGFISLVILQEVSDDCFCDLET